jgi:hypothetical protein
MTRDDMLRIYTEICAAATAVSAAQAAVHKATRGHAGCQLPADAYVKLGEVYIMLIQERRALSEELLQEAS